MTTSGEDEVSSSSSSSHSLHNLITQFTITRNTSHNNSIRIYFICPRYAPLSDERLQSNLTLTLTLMLEKVLQRGPNKFRFCTCAPLGACAPWSWPWSFLPVTSKWRVVTGTLSCGFRRVLLCETRSRWIGYFPNGNGSSWVLGYFFPS